MPEVHCEETLMPDYAQRLVWETEGRRGAAERGWLGEEAKRAEEARRQEEERAEHEADDYHGQEDRVTHQ